MAALSPQGGRAMGYIETGRNLEQGDLPPSSVLSMTPASGTRTCIIQTWMTPSVTGTTPIVFRSRASPCASARVFPNNSWYGGLLQHTCGHHAPFLRNGCTIAPVSDRWRGCLFRAVRVSNYQRSWCSYEAAYSAPLVL